MLLVIFITVTKMKICCMVCSLRTNDLKFRKLNDNETMFAVCRGGGLKHSYVSSNY